MQSCEITIQRDKKKIKIIDLIEQERTNQCDG